MKILKKTAIVTALVLGSMGAANANILSSQPEFSSSNLNVTVQNGVATLFGTSDSGSERSAAERFVAKMDGVDKVINLVTFQ